MIISLLLLLIYYLLWYYSGYDKENYMRNVISKLLQFKSQNTYYKWKKEERPIIIFLEKYFRKEDLEEFLETERIDKLENIDSTRAISIINFINKLHALYAENGSPAFFYDYIAHYTQCSHAFIDWSDSDRWSGYYEIKEFKTEFYKYLIDVKISMVDLMYISDFINKLDQSDLLFLNLNIYDGFTTLFNSDTEGYGIDFYSPYLKDSILKDMMAGLKQAFLNKLNKKPDNRDLKSLIKRSIEEGLEKQKEG